MNFKHVDFSGQNLSSVDFSDAILEDADFSNANLTNASFVNCRLNGACFNQANLESTDLTYADLAGTSFINADLNSAVLADSKVLRMNVSGANLCHCNFGLNKMPWALIVGWRDAKFSEGLLEELIATHGPAPSGVRVAMLMWEIPPLVAGGTWTAAYHLVRNLQKRGVRLTVVVPWSESIILPNPFGCDVELVPLGMIPPDVSTSPYGSEQTVWNPYTRAVYSPYATYGSPYAYASTPNFGNPYAPSQQHYTNANRGLQTNRGTGILRVAEEFRRRFLRLARHQNFDLIHAHDWVTFGAAQTAANNLSVPWVAHFHSTEYERRSQCIDHAIARIEQEAVIEADHIVTPSQSTANVIIDHYDNGLNNITAGKEDVRYKMTAIANSLSREDLRTTDLGRYESRRLVFTGRLTSQKGPDLFIDIFKRIHQENSMFTGAIYGTGELGDQLQMYLPGLQRMGALGWEHRSKAYNDASAILVTSRAEPFGMVILEAMQHSVPVFCTKKAGVHEFIDIGVSIDPEEPEASAHTVMEYLSNWDRWEQLVQHQSTAIENYVDQGHEIKLIGLWEQLVQSNAVPSVKVNTSVANESIGELA